MCFQRSLLWWSALFEPKSREGKPLAAYERAAAKPVVEIGGSHLHSPKPDLNSKRRPLGILASTWPWRSTREMSSKSFSNIGGSFRTVEQHASDWYELE